MNLVSAPPPLASCIMPTANRRRFVPIAIAQFLVQTYKNAELLILDDGADPVADLIPKHPAIRYLRTPRHPNLGAKRNAACEAATGDIILHWDDDDFYAPDRIRLQVQALLASGADICGTDSPLFIDPRTPAAWQYVYPKDTGPWVYGATLCYRRDFWRAHKFLATSNGEDTRFTAKVHPDRLHVLPDHRFYVALIHAHNTSAKRPRDARWRPHALEDIRAITGPLWPEAMPAAAPRIAGASNTALVTAASGIGDILRATPLIRVLHGLGYTVDVLIAPHSPEAADLLRGAAEIRDLFITADTTNRRHAAPPPEMAGRSYVLAIFTQWSRPLAAGIDAKRTLHFPQETWLAQGDTACVEAIARSIGWSDALPAPIACESGRDFALKPGTIALHPGCKPDWPWKKWHGFDALARRLQNVVVVGTAADLDNTGTYFARQFDWPDHVRIEAGTLRLADTAALIRQCGALVSNDSGLMHLGAALGVPTFGVFGITSPAREAMNLPHMVPITRQLACEPACRQKPWGRRNCEHDLACLKSLDTDQVLAQIAERLPELQVIPAAPSASAAQAQAPEILPEPAPDPPIRLAYYGAVFDASGYGAAARATIHALHEAGIRLSVVDTGARPPQVEDALVKSLLGFESQPDFHLMHGIPTCWARQAYTLRNVIAMTVWETDTMPAMWRNPLTHAVDVWLPCRFNVEVFGRALARQPFCLPHPLPPRRTPPEGTHDFAALGIKPDDFLVYACFEWQDRKNPRGTLQAFLQAFSAEKNAVLLLKTNPGAAGAAETALHAIRGETGLQGRVVLCCEAWDDARIAALHARGDCYLSLHKGEGWGYPLFDAACSGTPVVATGYSGPLDYLDPQNHWQVRHQPAPVRQAYAYYHPNMSWSEPDLSHAAEGLRFVYENRGAARAAAGRAALFLAEKYSAREIGRAAAQRLRQLRQSSLPTLANTPDAAATRESLAPPRPIPGAWYDRDYFEAGRKSNWDKGYNWTQFSGVFTDAARCLAELFPHAESFVDIGCAKGFLVRALRERGLDAWGVDHSPWAIQHADLAASPFLKHADLNDVFFDRAFDVTVVMSVFESLTEAQLAAFLARARRWTQLALFAVIALPEEGETPRGDLSQITLHGRDWWQNCLSQAGWRQDVFTRNFEQLARHHPVPARMRWNVHVLSPGGT